MREAFFRATNYTQSASERGLISPVLHGLQVEHVQKMIHINSSFEISRLLSQQKNTGKLYLEFLRVPALSAGVYVLPVGAEDKQQPHREDEIYYVVQGRGRFRAVDQGAVHDQVVEAGTILYVAAHSDHRFHDISEDLVLLVLFAPAETSG
jgi:oxalate decarboxylase/phosphoglucose isomerase-like protein (cupin superfamily)